MYMFQCIIFLTIIIDFKIHIIIFNILNIYLKNKVPNNLAFSRLFILQNIIFYISILPGTLGLQLFEVGHFFVIFTSLSLTLKPIQGVIIQVERYFQFFCPSTAQRRGRHCSTILIFKQKMESFHKKVIVVNKRKRSNNLPNIFTHVLCH